MKLKLAGALVAATAAITMLAGCPQVNTPDTGNKEEFKFSENALLTGEVKYGGKPVGQFFPEGHIQLILVKDAGVSGTLAPKSELYENSKFQFLSGIDEGKAYQVVFDYAGELAKSAEDINLIRLYVTEPATASKAAKDPMVSFDVKWEIKPTVGFDKEETGASVSFGFAALSIPDKEFEYQIQVVDPSQNGATLWSSTWKTSVARTWNRKAAQMQPGTLKPINGQSETDSPSGVDLEGDYAYRIKFRESGKTYGGKNVYGETQLVPLKLGEVAN